MGSAYAYLADERPQLRRELLALSPTGTNIQFATAECSAADLRLLSREISLAIGGVSGELPLHVVFSKLQVIPNSYTVSDTCSAYPSK